MKTVIDEIAPDVFRLSTFIPEVAAPAGFTFNQFLIRDDEPFLFHTGMRQLFPFVTDALRRIITLDRLRWIGFAHVEADECGAMNALLAAVPRAEVVHSELACMLSLNDMADRPPRAVAPGEVLAIGDHRLHFVPTPHVPHNWESALWFEEATGTLLGGDVFSNTGNGPPVRTDDLVEAAMAAEHGFHSTSVGPMVGATLRELAALRPRTVAVMHGSSFAGDVGAQLHTLAGHYDALASGHGDADAP